MKITFIRPNMFERRSSDAMEPLCFAILKARTPPDVETTFHDERLEAIPFDEPTDLVAMTVETYTARRAYQIAAEYRARGVPVVMGGYHPTFLPEEALQFGDAVVQGDAEGLWEQIVDDARRGELRSHYRLDTMAPLDGPLPDRSLFAGKRYGPIRMIQYGRGCRYNCEFCSIRAFYGSSLRQRPVKDVVAEIEALEAPFYFLVDDNVFVDVPRAKELFRALVPLKIRWASQVSIDIVKDPELVGLLEKSGCVMATVGFESLDVANLKQMKKSWNLRYGDYGTAVEILQDAGVMIYGTFVFGYDHDRVDSFEKAVDFAIRHRFALANFNPLTPTPAAALMDRLRREDRLLHDRWWLDPDYRYGHATFNPRGMSAVELTDGCYRARSRFNSWSSIARRLLDPRTNLGSLPRLGVYLLVNWTSRREIHTKQDLRLGGPAPLVPRKLADRPAGVLESLA